MKLIIKRTMSLIISAMLMFGTIFVNAPTQVVEGSTFSVDDSMMYIANEEGGSPVTDPPEKEQPKLTDISLPNVITVIAEQSIQVPVTIYPENAKTGKLTYIIMNEKIAKVSDTGWLTGISEGTTTLTVYTDTYLFARCSVTVQRNPERPTNIYFEPKSTQIYVGESQQLNLVQAPVGSTPEPITYTSNNTSIATVDAYGKVTGIKKGKTYILARNSLGMSATCDVTVNERAKITKISFASSTESLKAGDSKQLIIKQEPTTAISESISYSSSNESSVTVSALGLVKAVSAGTATITARSSSGLTATCKITVTETSKITRIYCSPDSITMIAGDSKKLNVIQEPTNEKGEKLTYESNDEGVVKVTKDGDLRAMNKGSARITVESASGLTAVCYITVKGKIQLNKKQLTIYYGQSANLRMKETNDSVTWRSSDKNIITVEDGKVKSTGVGTADVYAVVNGKTYTCSVTVKKPYINITKQSLEAGKKVKLRINTNKKVVWSSSNDKIATVSSAGIVTAKKTGKATITGMIDGKYTVKCYITVLRAKPDYTMGMSWTSTYYCKSIKMTIKNKGKLPVTIYSKGAFLWDDDYYSNDRTLYLSKTSSSSKVSSITIPPKKSATFWFRVSGNSTYFDYYSKLYYYMKYDGKTYRCYGSGYYGSYYNV